MHKFDAPASREMLQSLARVYHDEPPSESTRQIAAALDGTATKPISIQEAFQMAWNAGDDAYSFFDMSQKLVGSSPQIFSCEDILGEFGFRIVWGVQHHWANFIVYATVSCQNSQPRFDIADSPISGGNYNTPDLDEAEVYMQGHIKWDGCSDVDFGSHHWCGPDFWAKHILLMQHLFSQAFVLMRRDAADEGNVWMANITLRPTENSENASFFDAKPVPVTDIDMRTLRALVEKPRR
jgi:hypothetical protein